jgi:hypothetical protein
VVRRPNSFLSVVAAVSAPVALVSTWVSPVQPFLAVAAAVVVVVPITFSSMRGLVNHIRRVPSSYPFSSFVWHFSKMVPSIL